MDGLKATLSFDIDAHDYDDEYIYIDAINREIEIQNPNKVFGTQYDKDSMLIKFKVINAVSDVFKMSDSVIRINWKDSSNKTVNVTVGSSGTNIGTIPNEKLNGNINSAQEMALGWNRWKTSALRQWLNSNKPKGQWWKPQDQWDVCPDQLANKDGFLCGMPEQMLNSLKKIKVSTFANTVNDEGVEDITYDYVTLPSLGQIYAQTQIAGEGEPHTYWKRRSGSKTPLEWNKDYPNMITYSVDNKKQANYIRLRSDYRYSAYYTFGVNSSGSIYNSNASSATYCSPLVCIA